MRAASRGDRANAPEYIFTPHGTATIGVPEASVAGRASRRAVPTLLSALPTPPRLSRLEMRLRPAGDAGAVSGMRGGERGGVGMRRRRFTILAALTLLASIVVARAPRPAHGVRRPVELGFHLRERNLQLLVLMNELVSKFLTVRDSLADCRYYHLEHRRLVLGRASRPPRARSPVCR